MTREPMRAALRLAVSALEAALPVVENEVAGAEDEDLVAAERRRDDLQRALQWLRDAIDSHANAEVPRDELERLRQIRDAALACVAADVGLNPTAVNCQLTLDGRLVELARLLDYEPPATEGAA